LQQSEPRTIVLVTHDLREALRLAQRLIVLHGGRIAQHGPGEEIVNAPADEFVRTFFQTQLGSQKSEVRGQNSEVRNQESGVGSQKPATDL
jgi:ABC-type proline/glycine betaine transport system ATPase subunit